ncbi:uncharacterized protein LOC141901881 [Tubulanus polymorphus]|uniref:uncharacterized protein LOC141901881 n=1 Tax=Tubulanus polymorphus TaxID=672921 RepID=UPI003DA609E8
MGQKRKHPNTELPVAVSKKLKLSGSEISSKSPDNNDARSSKKSLKANTFVGKKIKIRKKLKVKKVIPKNDIPTTVEKRTVDDDLKAAENTKKKTNSGNPLPKSIQEVSANWKKLLKTLGTGDKKKKAKSKKEVSKSKFDTKTVESSEPDIWFDDVDEILLDSIKPKQVPEASSSKDRLVKENSHKGLTKVVAIDCEMVGVGEKGRESNLARVSIVNQYGQCIYDTFVKSIENVTDYRTWVSGVRAQDLKDAPSFQTVQKNVHSLLKGRIVVGHAIHNDFKVLYYDHPRKMIRDTSTYKPFSKLNGGRTPSLKTLSQKLLGVEVQGGEHSSVTDAQATMRLYTMYRKQWEKDIKTSLLKAKLLTKNSST